MPIASCSGRYYSWDRSICIQTRHDECFVFDAEGNVTSDTRAGLAYTYTYDPLNRLRVTKQDGTQVGVNVYDGASRLSTRVITNLDTANGTVHSVHLLGGGGDLDALMPGMGVVMGGLGNRVLAEIDGTTGVTAGSTSGSATA